MTGLEGCASRKHAAGGSTRKPAQAARVSSRARSVGNRITLPAATNLTGVTLTNELNAALLRPAEGLFTLGPGDSLEIEVLGSPASRVVTPVGPDGKIYFNLLPGLDVWGLTLGQTRELLERELGKYLSQPQIGVALRSVASQHVWLLGRLNRPGIYPMTGPTTLLEALSLAGGPARSSSQVTSEELADLRHSFVVRCYEL